MRDGCLLDFAGYLVNVELKDAKNIWGVLQIESTGLELKYKEAYLDKAQLNNMMVIGPNRWEGNNYYPDVIDLYWPYSNWSSIPYIWASTNTCRTATCWSPYRSRGAFLS